MKPILGRSFVVLLVVLLSISCLAIFNVKANPLPYQPLTIDLPKPKIYTANTIPLTAILKIPNEYPTPNNPNVTSVAWMKYSLDGNKNVSIIQFEQTNAWDIVGSIGYKIRGTTTLSELTNGNHSLTVYAQKTNNEVSSDTINFIIDLPFPTTIVIPSIVIVAFVGLGLFSYRIKTKRKT